MIPRPLARARLKVEQNKSRFTPLSTSIVGSINSCHVTIADACVMYSVMIADGSGMAAIAYMPPEMVVATIITVVIVPVVIIAIIVIVVAIITIVRISG